jgi:probable rRNA maturation factor
VPALVSIRNGPFADVSRSLLRRWAERMLRCLDLARAELSVSVTDDREIRELNRVFRHRDRATDVLAFAMREGAALGASSKRSSAARAEILGDVVISVEMARRQAIRERRPLHNEMRMLLAHGLLHLVGYDHRTQREEDVMTAQAERLCRAAIARPSERKSAVSRTRQTRRR